MASGDVHSVRAALAREALGIQPCPENPCEFCTGNSAMVKERGEDGKPVYMTSWEWRQDVNACAATIDWEKVSAHKDRY